MDFSKIKTVHFIGIGGIGTSAIARMFLLEGKRVSGSDMAESEVTDALKEAGATITIQGEEKMGIFQQSSVGRCPSNTSNIPKDCDLVIYTIAIPKEHAELVEAKKRGIPMLTYPEALGVISKDKYTIAITGTHGKTTTTAMVAKILMDAGLDPTVIIGSFLLQSPLEKGALHSDAGGLSTKKTTPVLADSDTPFSKGDRTNFVAGKSKPARQDDASGRSSGYLVVEGCEYRRSFLNLHPNILVITNIDADHLDYYRDLDDIKRAFSELAAKVPQDGAIVLPFSDPNIAFVVKAAHAPLLDYESADVSGLALRVPGAHNIANGRAALTVAGTLGIARESALRSLNDFRGTWRRFEYRGKAKNSALVYDDYGHHPTEIKATLQGARELFPMRKIVVVFQPHLYSRTKDHLAGFGKCFTLADEVILLPIYPAREIDPGDINSRMVADEIRKNGKSSHYVGTFAESAKLALKLSSTGDLILTLGAGETNKVADILVHKS